MEGVGNYSGEPFFFFFFFFLYSLFAGSSWLTWFGRVSDGRIMKSMNQSRTYCCSSEFALSFFFFFGFSLGLTCEYVGGR